MRHRTLSRPHPYRRADELAQSQAELTLLLYGSLFLTSIVLTGIALVLIDDGVWLLGIGFLAPVGVLGLWMSRA